MRVRDLLLSNLTLSQFVIDRDLDGLDRHGLAATSPGAPHPIWLLGHLAYFEQLTNQVISGQPMPKPEWLALFGSGSSSPADAQRFPDLPTVIAVFHRERQRNIDLLTAWEDADFDRPCVQVPAGLEPLFSTWGGAMQTLAFHTLIHRGQLSAIRHQVGLAGSLDKAA